ncbi:GTP 3',8-cyclase MoaA [Desulfonema ishimotonii]|uniref:GTP 3',8-cyclase n=1 Tax=Desulfonema ishimotonii TaxID=45657 RepID=A0A401G0D9_9BACT|nr:GTP 3',8-cyclase MoaA [Desulfonema ishimotonii]GBC62681.1 GTP 3',8-cyclase MoaA [Desulfonema ishimotonii]
MKNSTLTDNYQRNLKYLRVSITDRCNLRCVYCAPTRAHIPRLRHRDVLRYEEILRVVRLGVRLGISKVRITGGEPLVRKGVCDFLAALGEINGIRDLSLTTNGVLLKKHISAIKAAGVRRLNISLDTLSPEKFDEIAGHNYFKEVWEGILAAHDAGFHPIKINTVAMKGVNDDELADIARLSFDYPFHMRFIEYMPIGDKHMDAGKTMLAPEIMDRLSTIGPLQPIDRNPDDGPADRYQFKDAAGEVGFIRPLSQHFCETCNRLRLTASGEIRPCLLSDRQVDLKTPIRKGYTDDVLVETIFEAVRLKPASHHLNDQCHEEIHSAMSSIGG